MEKKIKYTEEFEKLWKRKGRELRNMVMHPINGIPVEIAKNRVKYYVYRRLRGIRAGHFEVSSKRISYNHAANIFSRRREFKSYIDQAKENVIEALRGQMSSKDFARVRRRFGNHLNASNMTYNEQEKCYTYRNPNNNNVYRIYSQMDSGFRTPVWKVERMA